MARFAADCLQQMKEVAETLVPILGDDTVDLALRIGMHR